MFGKDLFFDVSDGKKNVRFVPYQRISVNSHKTNTLLVQPDLIIPVEISDPIERNKSGKYYYELKVKFFNIPWFICLEHHGTDFDSYYNQEVIEEYFFNRDVQIKITAPKKKLLLMEDILLPKLVFTSDTGLFKEKYTELIKNWVYSHSPGLVRSHSNTKNDYNVQNSKETKTSVTATEQTTISDTLKMLVNIKKRHEIKSFPSLQISTIITKFDSLNKHLKEFDEKRPVKNLKIDMKAIFNFHRLFLANNASLFGFVGNDSDETLLVAAYEKFSQKLSVLFENIISAYDTYLRDSTEQPLHQGVSIPRFFYC
ncbi:hypothetical protein CDIK_1839 [Cucumispora dikerogammari]|nr:hypothetical protein CDIK_1839 [Cucumispora dikerogammari]